MKKLENFDTFFFIEGFPKYISEVYMILKTVVCLIGVQSPILCIEQPSLGMTQVPLKLKLVAQLSLSRDINNTKSHLRILKSIKLALVNTSGRS